MKKKYYWIVGIVAIVIIGIFFWSYYSLCLFCVQLTEEEVKLKVMTNISNFEDLTGANVTFTKIDIRGIDAIADIHIDWGQDLCVGYRYTIRNYVIISREQTFVC